MLSKPDLVVEATMDAVRERVKTLYGTQDNSQRTIKILEQKLLEGNVLEPVLDLLYVSVKTLVQIFIRSSYIVTDLNKY